MGREKLLVGPRIPQIPSLPGGPGLKDTKCSGSVYFKFIGTLTVSTGQMCPLWDSKAQRCEERKHNVPQ